VSGIVPESGTIDATGRSYDAVLSAAEASSARPWADRGASAAREARDYVRPIPVGTATGDERARSDVARGLAGIGIGIAGVVVATAALLPFHDSLTRAAPALVLVLPVMVAAIRGGMVAAVVVALAATAAFSLGFIPPVGTLRVDLPEDAVALVAFLLVAIVAAALVAREVERRRIAEARRADLLEHVDRQRAALLRSVSHDLRTPLSIIRAVASELQAEPSYDAATRGQLLDLVNDEADRLDRIVANVLSLSRIESGALTPRREEVDLTELVEHAATRSRPLFTNHTLRLDLATDMPLVSADYVLIDQVVTNLLENGVRHTPPGTTVLVTTRRSGDGALVVVADDGEGIDPEVRTGLFEPFRSGARTTTGIGLAICAAIVEAHGGTLRAGDSPDGGACFQFTLPLHR
jgi:K+-sensing histidine kinase KdpD